MQTKIKIKNLGKLTQGEIKIRPLTILTGENGAGKSFFTKSLYSILSVFNKNALHIDIVKNIKQIEVLLFAFIENINQISETDRVSVQNLQIKLQELGEKLNSVSEENIDIYLAFSSSCFEEVDGFLSTFDEYLKEIIKKPTKQRSVARIIDTLSKLFKSLWDSLADSNGSYVRLLGVNLDVEIKENFQIADLSELVSFEANKCEISSDLFTIKLGKNGIEFNLKHKFINEVTGLSRVVFFESPAYWKVRNALIEAKQLSRKSDLTGVPKYFYDLDQTLTTKSTENIPEISKLADKLQQALGGKFSFKNGSFTFKDDLGNELSKNLVSFGMTNLGMVQTLLTNNVITKGSFVFFDEPETNLHPQWQVLLMQTLIKLADHDINVVIATHSIDMIKALEVGLKNKDNLNDTVSINYFNAEGTLTKFEAENKIDQLIESREILSASYEKLYFEDALSD
ncbi:MAG: AAA family ATPase [Methylococcales symbiont of Iophon sp. n. MRB-2018]|nr:MAG: AAA family ATPase [Methylococcales symbiont of Iophon sp. n. MRB-2018]KAF3979355.1 MAG: AAA family ATPase [Methylococcales symbiont of Iophon sp. n. MRB-2018]